MKPSSFVFIFIIASYPSCTVARSFLDGEQGRLVHSSRAETLKSVLLPMFKSLPKNQQGNLVPQVARYALHRLFEQQHSWSVNGLRPARSTQERVLDLSVQFGETLEGISVNSLALLAATIEDGIDKETISQLQTMGVEMDKQELNAEELSNAVERYMKIYISGMREYNLTEGQLVEQNRYMEESTQDWHATIQWIHDAEQDVVRNRKPCGHGVTDCIFDGSDAAHVVKELVKDYGHFNQGECRHLKDTLLKMEDRKSGRVSLSDFYKEGMSGTWEFNEKVDYLRDLGALDESMPGQPRLIVTNYVNSWVNCLMASDLYSVCCRNECEDLMGHLERSIESPTASPDRILQHVRTFRSTDFAMPANISELLHERLTSIADKHQGAVPLHGRLFAQWLHHVFPQNCPYPHAAGATNPLTPDEWMKESGHNAIKASHTEIMRVVGSVAVDGNGGVHSASMVEEDQDAGALPWSDVEEVFVIQNLDRSREVWQEKRLLNMSAAITVVEVAISMGLVFLILRIAKAWRPRRVFKAPTYEKLAI